MEYEKRIIKLIVSKFPEGTKEYKKIVKLLNQAADHNYNRGHYDGYGQCNSVRKECAGGSY